MRCRLERVGRGSLFVSVSTFETALICTDMPPPWVADGRERRSFLEERSLHLNTGAGLAANAVSGRMSHVGNTL